MQCLKHTLPTKKTVLIYRDQLLPYSETFIPAQVENFSSYIGFYIGSTRLPKTEALIPHHKTILLEDKVSFPEFWKTAYKLGGLIHPRWLNSLTELSPSLIHAHFGLDGVLVLPLAQKLRVPLVVTFHGYYATAELQPDQIKYGYGALQDFVKRRGQFFRQLYVKRQEQLFIKAQCLIAVSDFIRSKLIAKGCPSEKIIVHHIGVDVDQFSPNPSSLREPIVLFVGRLVEKKGCEYLIRAMADVQSVMPNVELVIIGDGPQRSTLERLAANSLKCYRFLGVQPSKEVRAWMQRSLVLGAPSVTTSQGETEGLPIVILEALAIGLPVVSSIHAGIPDAVIHEQTGFLTQEKDWEALAKYILTLLQDAQLRERFAASGRQHVERVFNLKRNTAKLEEIYSTLLESN